MSINLKKWLKENKLTNMDVVKGAGVASTSVVKYCQTGGEGMRIPTVKRIENFVNNYHNKGDITSAQLWMPTAIKIDDLWKHLPKKAMWIAADEDGGVYAYEKEPIIRTNSWESVEGEVQTLPLLIDFGVDSWKDTKTRRPFNYWEYIGKCGIFSDNHSDAEVWGVLLAITDKGMFRSEKFHLFEKFRPLTDEEKGNLA